MSVPRRTTVIVETTARMEAQTDAYTQTCRVGQMKNIMHPAPPNSGGDVKTIITIIPI